MLDCNGLCHTRNFSQISELDELLKVTEFLTMSSDFNGSSDRRRSNSTGSTRQPTPDFTGSPERGNRIGGEISCPICTDEMIRKPIFSCANGHSCEMLGRKPDRFVSGIRVVMSGNPDCDGYASGARV